MKIVVIGGTGLIGSKVVKNLDALGHKTLAAAPATGVDTVTGDGLADAFAGADIVVDMSNSPSFEDGPAMSFFQTAGRNIAAAELAAGVKHHVALSVVGTERLQASGYFRAKLAQETIIRESGVPFSILHATQFMEFLRGIAQSAIVDDKVRLSDAFIQPIAADDVARFVTDIAVGPPRNSVVEIAGPQAFLIPDVIGQVLNFDGDDRPIVVDPKASYFGVQLSPDSLLPTKNALLGSTTFDWWLENVPPPPKH